MLSVTFISYCHGFVSLHWLVSFRVEHCYSTRLISLNFLLTVLFQNWALLFCQTCNLIFLLTGLFQSWALLFYQICQSRLFTDWSLSKLNTAALLVNSLPESSTVTLPDLSSLLLQNDCCLCYIGLSLSVIFNVKVNSLRHITRSHHLVFILFFND